MTSFLHVGSIFCRGRHWKSLLAIGYPLKIIAFTVKFGCFLNTVGNLYSYSLILNSTELLSDESNGFKISYHLMGMSVFELVHKKLVFVMRLNICIFLCKSHGGNKHIKFGNKSCSDNWSKWLKTTNKIKGFLTDFFFFQQPFDHLTASNFHSQATI